MGAYILRRCLAGLVTLLVASFLVFLLVAYPATRWPNAVREPAHLAGDDRGGQDPAAPQRATARALLDLADRHAAGNFGTATTGQAVGAQLGARLLVTLRMVIPATILASIIAVLIGVVSAVRQYSITRPLVDRPGVPVLLHPVFVVAILLKDFFAVDFNNAVGHTVSTRSARTRRA